MQSSIAARRRVLDRVFGSRSTCRSRGAEREPIKFPDTQYEPVDWADIDGWASDDHATAFATFLESCRALNASRQPVAATVTPIADALKAICERAFAAIPLEEDGARQFFEDNFRPLRISKLGDTDGFLTGYYEPIIEGSRVPTGEFTAPLYRRPPNLVVSGRRKLGDAFPEQGRQGRPPRRPPQDRALLRSRRDRGRRARRLASGNLLAAQPDRRAVRANSGLGADQAGRRHHPARQLRLA